MDDVSNDSSLVVNVPSSKGDNETISSRTTSIRHTPASHLVNRCMNAPVASPTATSIAPSHLVNPKDISRAPSRAVSSNLVEASRPGAVVSSLAHPPSNPWSHFSIDHQSFGLSRTPRTIGQPRRQRNPNQPNQIPTTQTTFQSPDLGHRIHRQQPKSSREPSSSQRCTVIHNPIKTDALMGLPASNTGLDEGASPSRSTQPDLTTEAQKITRILLNANILSKGNIGSQEIEALIQNGLQNSLVSLNLCKEDASNVPPAVATGGVGRLAEMERHKCDQCFKIKKTHSDLK